MTGRADGLNMLISRRGCFVVCSQVLRSEIGNAQLEVCFRMYSICTVVKWLLLTRIMQVQTILTPLRPASLVLGLGEINWLHRHASHGTSCLVGPVPACQASLQVSFPRRKRKTFLPLLPLLALLPISITSCSAVQRVLRIRHCFVARSSLHVI
jgi:hypothetical protein